MHPVVLNYKTQSKQQPSNTTVQHIHTATRFDPTGSSSGWFLEQNDSSTQIPLWQ